MGSGKRMTLLPVNLVKVQRQREGGNGGSVVERKLLGNL